MTTCKWCAADSSWSHNCIRALRRPRYATTD
ncbi:hypothetical protein SEA_FILCH_108 [Mycobacterium phage Filch]|nr:hypothetical protein SEA_FILCH_108 [Mycobacterium phage Filch]